MKKSEELLGVELYSKNGLHFDAGLKIEIIGAFDASLVAIVNSEINLLAGKIDVNVSPTSLMKDSWKNSITNKFELLKKIPSKLDSFLGKPTSLNEKIVNISSTSK